MSVNQFTRDAAYFQSRRDSEMPLNADDLDFQFNDLVNYLNTKIVPTIGVYEKKEFIGVEDNALIGACLLNVGDGNVRWEKINSNFFSNYSIPFSKFATAEPNCVIWTGSDGVFACNAMSNLNDGILFSRNNQTPVWRKVNTGDIADQTVTGANIQLEAVNLEHLSASLQQELTSLPSLVLNTSLIEEAIVEPHFENGSIFYEKLSSDLRQARQIAINENRYQWVDNSIENKHISPKTLIGGYGPSSVPYSKTGITYMCVQMKTHQYIDDEVNYTFTPNNIINESITGDLIDFDPSQRVGPRHFERGAIEPRHIQDNSFSPNGSFSPLRQEKKIPASALDPEIRKLLRV